jgi:hypothetical protein
MADADASEAVLTEPPNDTSGQTADTTSAVDAVVESIASVANALIDKVSASTNEAPTPPETVKTVPKLEEKVVQGWVFFKPFDLTVVNVYGKWVEKNTAYDFLLMKEAAAAEGLSLGINVGFRTYEVQEILRRERVNPDGTLTELGKKYGVAAKPGNSNHQAGIALDLLVGMTIADKKDGKFSAIFLWLQKNAATYGFDNNEVPSEPWHWRHLPKTIVGPRAGDQDYLLSLVSKAATAAAVSQSATKTEGQKLLDRTAHAITSAQERSAAMARTARSTLHAEMGRFAVFRGAFMQQLASMFAQGSQTIPQAPPTISKEASKAIRFDFTTGKWGDGRPN